MNPSPLNNLFNQRPKRKQSHLTDEIVRQIRLDHRDGTTITELATRNRVSMSTISAIVHRRSWTHVKLGDGAWQGS